jgi:hypothetical protein
MAVAKPPIVSKMILGVRCTPHSEAKLRAAMPNILAKTEINLSIFEVHIDKQVRYCCWSGGTLRDDVGQLAEPRMTVTGQAAAEALMNLPFADPQGAVVMKELLIGKTTIREKVLSVFRQTADTREVICFVGDLAGELDDHMFKAFNVVGSVNIIDCVGLKKPWD